MMTQILVKLDAKSGIANAATNLTQYVIEGCLYKTLSSGAVIEHTPSTDLFGLSKVPFLKSLNDVVRVFNDEGTM
jgi:hypothetical protein